MNNVAFFVYSRRDMKIRGNKTSFILASQSPRRRLLLKQIGLKFVVRPSTVAERFVPEETPSHNVRRLALEKARDWAQSDTYRSFPLSAVNTAISAATRAEPSATTPAPN